MGGKTTTSTNKVEIPKEVLARYNAVNAQAAKVAQNPFQQYGTQASDFVAQFNDQQLQGVEGINRVAGMGAAYENVDKYLNPYIQNVADTTRAQMEQANEQAQSGALGTAIQSGAFGGDRAGVAAANLANQQNLAMGSTMANIYGQGYDQAVSTSMADANRLLGVAGAQLGAGTQMQQTEQAGKDALINQFQQQMGYPFQVAQFLANIAMGTGALSGSTTTSTQQGSFFSDRRLKHDIKEIGTSHNGLPIYTFKYKGDPESNTHVGFMADEVEKKNPEAVGLDPSGYKTVDYDKATHSMGGGVAPRHSGEAFAAGGVAGPYGSQVGQQVGLGTYVPQAYLPVSDLMMADPNFAAQHAATASDILDAAATAGKSFVGIRDTFGPKGTAWRKGDAYGGGVTGGYAGGGMVQPQKHGDYLSSTLAAQEAGRDKPELKTAQPPEKQESGFSQLVNTLGNVAKIASFGFADGGVAGARHGYADGSAVGLYPEEIARKIRQDMGNTSGMQTQGFKPAPLNRNEIPAPQTLGSLPDATVQRVETSGPSASSIATDVMFPSLVGARAAMSKLNPPENNMTTPEYLASFNLGERIPAAAASALNLAAAPVAGAAGLAAGAFGAPEAGNALMEFSGDRMRDARDAATAAFGSKERVDDMYRRAAMDRFNAESPTGVVPAATPASVPPRVPTGVAVPVSTPVDGQTRPVARPEGLGLRPSPVPMAPSDLTGIAPAQRDQRKIAGVIGGGKGFTDVVYDDGSKDRITGNLNFRNNNPGNLEYGELAQKYGAVGTDGRFAVFPDYETGRKAQEALLFESGVYDGMTIGSAIAKYAPVGDGDNDPVRYARNVSAALGVPVDTPLEALTPEQRSIMLTAMEKQEGGSGTQSFSTTPIGVDGKPMPPVGATGGLSGRPVTRGADKPYEERNFLGKIMRNEDGTMNKDAMLSLIAGVGDMLSSPSPFLLPSIGAGLSGAANTYMAREGQLADIAQKQAQTNETEVRTDVSRFFSAIPGADGFPLVNIAPGKVITLTEFLKNPVEFSTGDASRDAALLQEAQRIAGGSASPSGGATQAPPSGVRWGSQSDAAVEKAVEKLQNRPGDFSSNDRESRAIMEGASQARSTALANKPNSNELAFTVASAIGDNNMGSVEGYLSDSVIPGLNAVLRTLPGFEPISVADSQQEVLRKLASMSGANLTPDQQRAASVFQQFASLSPSLRMTPEGAATITASLMLQDQDAIDRANYYSAFMGRSGSGVSMADVDAAYANEYSQMQQTEKEALKQLILLSSDPAMGQTVRNFFDGINSGSASQEDAQAVLGYILGENSPPLLARYFIKGM
jgi:hypothetical protein